jgi:hypothetical protein
MPINGKKPKKAAAKAGGQQAAEVGLTPGREARRSKFMT